MCQKILLLSCQKSLDFGYKIQDKTSRLVCSEMLERVVCMIWCFSTDSSDSPNSLESPDLPNSPKNTFLNFPQLFGFFCTFINFPQPNTAFNAEFA